jgi:hypothetical protein
MDLNPYVGTLGRELLDAIEIDNDVPSALIDRLTATMESAIRLTLLETLSAAAAEITSDLAPGSVQVRLRGRDPHFVVTSPQAHQPAVQLPPRVVALADGAPASVTGPSVRMNVRLPEQLKAAIEDAAGSEGRSLNAWMVRAASQALQCPGREHSSTPHGAPGPQAMSSPTFR